MYYKIQVNKDRTQAHVYFWIINKTVGFHDSSGRVLEHVFDFLGGAPYKYYPGLIPTRAELYADDNSEDNTEIIDLKGA